MKNAFPIVLTIVWGIIMFKYLEHETIKFKTKYEYHIILTNDSVFVFDRYDKQIGNYKSTNPKEKFDSILLLDNL